MSAVEQPADYRGGDIGCHTAHQAMLASIDRTGYYSPKKPWIPLLSLNQLIAGNERVAATIAPDAIRRVIVVGPDAVKFEGQEELVLPSYRTAELLGLLILKRELLPPKHYLEEGLFKQSSSLTGRSAALSQATNRLQDSLIDQNGKPLATRSRYPEKSRLGVVDVVVTDIRHTIAYKKARRRSAHGLFETYLRNGGHFPGLVEQPAVEGSRAALRSFAGSGMNEEQRKRFTQLSKEVAAMLVHKADTHDQKYPLASAQMTSFAKRRIFNELSPEWQDRSACGLETKNLFFHRDHERKAEKISREVRAKEICRSCPVQVDCLTDALDREEPFGIWGGLNEDERRRLYP